MRVFFDSEFTGLRQDTTLISIGLVAEDGNMFYAEFTDYDQSQVYEWLQENVINNLWLSNPEQAPPSYLGEGKLVTLLGSKGEISEALRQWLSQWDRVEMWADIIPLIGCSCVICWVGFGTFLKTCLTSVTISVPAQDEGLRAHGH